jgi:myosin-5
MSVVSQFRKELTTLLDSVQKTDISYVRCIRPNSVKRPDTFDRKLVAEQLRYSRLLSSLNCHTFD